MAQTFGIPSTSLAKIQRMLNAKRAAGLTVQPWELESAFKAEMDSISDKQTSNRSLGIQEASLAETKRMNDVNTRLREDEARLREEEIAAGKKTSTLGAVGNIGTTVLMGKALGLWGKDAPAEKITEAATKGGTGASLQGAPETGLPFKTVMKNTVTRETFPEASYSEGVDAPGVSGQSLIDTTTPPVESTGTQLAPAAEVPTTTSTPSITWGKGIGSGAAGLAAGKIIKDTGVGEWISNKAPFGGTREWNTATGAGVGAGIGYAIGGPWGAAIGAVTGGAGGGGLLDNWF